jgi:dihydroflavonol-4-reductase
MTRNGKLVLVTGGSGFIGEHLVDALIARGCRVRILDIRQPRNFRLDVQYIAGSAHDPVVTDESLHGIDEVYHLAGIPGLWRANKEDFVTANIKCTEVMLAAARRRGVARFLHCSTESVLFGRKATADFVTEGTDNLVDDMPGLYARSKKTAEQMALSAATEGANVVVANPTMPIGPHPYELTPPTAMIARFLARRVQFYIDCTFNLADVRDVAAGLLLVMERGNAGERYILGGENITLRHLLDRIAILADMKRMSIRIPETGALVIAATTELLADYVARRAPAATREGVRIALRARPLSSDKACRELGYTSRPLDVSLRETICWLTERRSGAKLTAGA